MQTDRSPFEAELLSGAAAIRGWQQKHDRYVVIGLLVSLLPLPPASIVALLMARINYRFVREAKLPVFETKLIRLSVLFSVLGLVSFAFLALAAYDMRTGLLDWLSSFLAHSSPLRWIFGHHQTNDTTTI